MILPEVPAGWRHTERKRSTHSHTLTSSCGMCLFELSAFFSSFDVCAAAFVAKSFFFLLLPSSFYRNEKPSCPFVEAVRLCGTTPLCTPPPRPRHGRHCRTPACMRGRRFIARARCALTVAPNGMRNAPFFEISLVRPGQGNVCLLHCEIEGEGK